MPEIVIKSEHAIAIIELYDKVAEILHDAMDKQPPGAPISFTITIKKD